MKYISKIEISHFRSLNNAKVTDLKSLNIISGKNDSGKSNVIRAIELFFSKNSCSFKDDYNKERMSGARKIKEKHVITIALTFTPPPGYSLLPKQVRVSRTWDKTGEMINERNNLESKYTQLRLDKKKLVRANASLSMFLNKFRFVYIPAVRDERFFNDLLQILQRELFAAEDRKANKNSNGLSHHANSFNQEIGRLTTGLNAQFRTATGIDTHPSLPTAMEDLFKALQIDTHQGEYVIPLSMRGHGVRMRYIPAILHHISNISRQFYLWGFDEPENSCEYTLCSQMASDFKNDYSKKTQIFVVSHSFSFISLRGLDISRFRVYKSDGSDCSLVQLIEDDSHILENDLGILSMNDSLQKVYSEYQLKVNLMNEMETALSSFKMPLILFEGSSDAIHFEIAYKVLYKQDISTKYHLEKHDHLPNGDIGGGAGNLCKFLTQFTCKLDKNKLVIAIFDYDKEGFDQFNSICAAGKSPCLYENISHKLKTDYKVLKKKNGQVYAILLVPPPNRIQFTDDNHAEYCLLTTELLYSDSIITENYRKYPSKYDKTVFSFSGQKIPFAEQQKRKATTFKAEAISGFKPTFELIEEIFKFSKTGS